MYLYLICILYIQCLTIYLLFSLCKLTHLLSYPNSRDATASKKCRPAPIELKELKTKMLHKLSGAAPINTRLHRVTVEIPSSTEAETTTDEDEEAQDWFSQMLLIESNV